MRFLAFSATILTCLALVGCRDKDETGDTAITEADIDGDGVNAPEDCNDEDASIFPGAVEVCDGLDNNCDYVVDEGVTTAWYADSDQDGYGDPGQARSSCEAPSGYVADNTDCDDTNALVSPAAAETCDGLDNDCDGTADEEVGAAWYVDADTDGYGDDATVIYACGEVSGYVSVGGDCNDADPTAMPGGMETCDGVDNDCNGLVDDGVLDAPTWYQDGDGDGFGDASSTAGGCVAPSGYVADASDCDDGNPFVYPGATEACDGFDNDCDGTVDVGAVDAPTWYEDADADGFGNPAVALVSCTADGGWVADATDCDDTDPSTWPGAGELCDGADNDCDGTIDEETTGSGTWYADLDGDGYGDATSSVIACEMPEGFVADATDCDDANSAVNPGAAEVCDALDNDCTGVADDGAVDAATWYGDVDGDGYGSPTDTVVACEAPVGYGADATDCDDTDENVNPVATEVCDGLDNDCDAIVDDGTGGGLWYADFDGDGYGDPASAVEACTQPPGYLADGSDCDDADATVNPTATEICDGLDNDCTGAADEGLDSTTWYEDMDGDGWGNPSTALVACVSPGLDYTTRGEDCDDLADLVNPDGEESCNGLDDDCDGTVDVGAVDGTTFWADADGDGYGDPATEVVGCEPPPGHGTDGTDCDDTDATVNPAATDICDGLDNDCDGVADDGTPGATWYADADGDGFGDAATATTACVAPEGYVADATDCDDSDADRFPGALWYLDEDGDGQGGSASADACGDVTGYAPVDGDCDDANDRVWMGRREACDGVDNSCDGVVDEACDDCTYVVPAEAPTIQDAIDATVSGEMVCVSAGTYVENLNFGGRGITVTSEDGAEVTIIDGSAGAGTAPVVNFKSGEGPDAILSGFTLTGGSYAYGGGILVNNSSPTLEHLIITGNQATTGGGGAYIQSSAPTLTWVTISDNTAPNGGGLYVYTKSGYATASPILDQVRIEGNAADAVGGGLYVYRAEIGIYNSRIEDNVTSTSHGGGLWAESSTLDIANVLVKDNAAASSGGGLYFRNANTVDLDQVIVDLNEAGLNGGGVFVASYNLVTVRNSILVYNVSASDGGGLYDYDVATNTYAVTYNDIAGNSPDNVSGVGEFTGVDGNVAVSPAFHAHSAENMHLSTTSTLIDAGDPAVLDADGSPSDMGLYGGPGGALWDLDADGYFEWYTPGAYSSSKDAGMDCKDLVATTYPGSGC